MSESDGAATPDAAREVLAFWRDAGPKLWFARDEAFDTRFRERFLALHERAARDELSAWTKTADGALALILLLDQFPRNSFRGTARMFATDALARRVASAMIDRGQDQEIDTTLRAFVYLPFEHSEDLADQDRSVELCRTLDAETAKWADLHRDIIRRFGRFPHRNKILGRAITPDEQAFIDGGGFAG
ncbi:MAG: DUF924 family protein [Alphaproteobacteria bacterium]|jgi:uncharacterized protein (DUF924 family)|nr:DUF924 family protein [Alphaproteobacteria bacterium]